MNQRIRFVVMVSMVLTCMTSVGAAADTIFPAPGITSGTLTGMVAGSNGEIWYSVQNTMGKGLERITPDGTITSFPVQTNGCGFDWCHGARSLTIGPGGDFWMINSNGNAIVRVNASGTKLSEFALPQSTGAEAIAAGSDGNLWFTAGAVNRIGRMSTTGVLTEFPIPTADSGASQITSGPDGNMWFTERTASKIGRVTPSGVITEYATVTPDSQPYDIVVAADGALWFSEVGSGKIGRITTDGSMTEMPIPDRSYGFGPLRLAAGSDQVWIAPGYGPEIASMTLEGDVTFVPFSGGNNTSNLGEVAVASDGAVWFHSTAVGGFVRISALPAGDANGDETVGAGDIFYLVNHLFAGGPDPIGNGDANGDGDVSAGDVFYLVNFVFAGGPAPR